MKAKDFDLLLFSTNLELITEAVRAGIVGIIVDLEDAGKKKRQEGFDTHIGMNTFDDLIRVRMNTDSYLICRINPFGNETYAEIQQCIDAGVDEIFLPMVRTVGEVERSLNYTKRQCRLSILIETMEAARSAAALGSLPISRVYVGLNDLAIDRRVSNIFTSLVDGTVEDILAQLSVPYGFGGITLPTLGSPVPAPLFMAEMVRLGCSFGFLRRSFLRDVANKRLIDEVPKIKRAIEELESRNQAQRETDRLEFLSLISCMKKATVNAEST